MYQNPSDKSQFQLLIWKPIAKPQTLPQENQTFLPIFFSIAPPRTVLGLPTV